MNAYIYQADMWCPECTAGIKKRLLAEGRKPLNADDERTFDSDDWPKGPYADGGGESDSPQHCAECRAFLENPLTTEGYEYVKSAIVEHLINPQQGTPEVLSQWADCYDVRLNTSGDDVRLICEND